MAETFGIGDRVFYKLRKSIRDGRPEDLYLSATVSKFARNKRVVIVVDWNHHSRSVDPSGLAKAAPTGAWIK